MDAITLIVLALGLSMDAFAVSVSNSMCYPSITKAQSFWASLSFGLFQGIMPAIGFFGGLLFADFIMGIDHWVALVLLGFIGGKMLVEAVRELRSPAGCEVSEQQYTAKTMLLQAVATSIDALAVGISFATLAVNIFAAASSIALITFVCCLLGSFLGRKAGELLGSWAQLAGGVILVGIGIKIFLEHMFSL